ncbi:MAG: hypothetical protein VB087_05855 [Candidatus Limiplasma sp.]|nr:hypothetical protein [Candidatus Limiplasma sp.]MEA5146425.1 hypothetical protein [Candidatus Limiplasma sp.]
MHTASGYSLRPEYAHRDAGFGTAVGSETNTGCLCGQVITGRLNPPACPHFGGACTPTNPLGPCMISQEGTCGIWYSNGT